MSYDNSKERVREGEREGERGRGGGGVERRRDC